MSKKTGFAYRLVVKCIFIGMMLAGMMVTGTLASIHDKPYLLYGTTVVFLIAALWLTKSADKQLRLIMNYVPDDFESS